jgi:proteasome lid subunit RPN8/RPN11
MNEAAPVQLHISTHQAEALRRAAVDAYPHECCGLLAGVGQTHITVTEVVPTANMAESPSRSFAIDPQAQFDLLRATRDTGRRVVGHFHSHPDGGQVPSTHDLVMAYDPEAIWVVIAVSAGKASLPRAFRHPQGHNEFVEVPVSILGSGGH